MLAVITVCFSLLAAIKVRPVTAQTFGLVCQGNAGYPDVCDTFSFANLCHGISNVQHYDGTNDARKGPWRRAAVGSTGVANQCSGQGATIQCDEYPYASTYDGGLGCYPDGYHGQDHLAQSGATRCANGPQNGRHGQAIGQFYANTLHHTNGQLVGYQGNVRGPLGQAIAAHGIQICPSGSGTDIYRYRSTPATSKCPARGYHRAVDDGSSSNSTDTLPFQILFRNVTAESGRVVTVPYRHDEADVVENLLAVGQPVWTHDDEGNGIAEKIVTSNLMD